MSDWVTAIVQTPYLVVPVVAYLWAIAKLPKPKWDRIAAGVLMVFSADFLNALAQAFVPYAAQSWGAAFMALFSFIAIVAKIVGLAIVGLYLLVDALLLWKI